MAEKPFPQAEFLHKSYKRKLMLEFFDKIFVGNQAWFFNCKKKYAEVREREKAFIVAVKFLHDIKSLTSDQTKTIKMIEKHGNFC